MMVKAVAGHLMSLIKINRIGKYLPADGESVFILPDKIFQAGIEVEGGLHIVFVQQFHEPPVPDRAVVKTDEKDFAHGHASKNCCTRPMISEKSG